MLMVIFTHFMCLYANVEGTFSLKRCGKLMMETAIGISSVPLV